MMGDNKQQTLQMRVDSALTRLRTGTPLNEKNLWLFEAARHHSEPVTINLSMLAREAGCSRQTLYDRCSHLLPLTRSGDSGARLSPKAAETQDVDSATLVSRLQVELAAERAALAESTRMLVTARAERIVHQSELKVKSRQLRYVQAECHVLQQALIELNKQIKNLTLSREVMINRTRLRKTAAGDGSSPVVPFDGRHEP